MDEPELQRERRLSIELEYAIIAILLVILLVAYSAEKARASIGHGNPGGETDLAEPPA
jgi:hypothetical protein